MSTGYTRGAWKRRWIYQDRGPSDNNQLPPALTAFAPDTPDTAVLSRAAEVGLPNRRGPSMVRAGAGRGNFERYRPCQISPLKIQ